MLTFLIRNRKTACNSKKVIVRIKVKVIPRAKKQDIIVLPDGSLKVKLISPPEKGKANKELIKSIAEYYRIRKSAVRIINGEQSREKILEILRFT